jgi:hypothetical protein
LSHAFRKFIEFLIHNSFRFRRFQSPLYFGVMTKPFKFQVTVPVVGEVNITTSVI